MSQKAEGNIVRQTCVGKLTMVFDVFLNNRYFVNVAVEAVSPHGEANVYFPSGLAIKDEEKDIISNMLLARYYGVDTDWET